MHREDEYIQTKEVPLRAWPLRLRYGGFGRRGADPSAVSSRARIGGTTILGLLLVVGSMPTATAAAGASAPDPAPQTAPAGVTSSSPTPDPAPRTGSVRLPAGRFSPAFSSGHSVTPASSTVRAPSSGPSAATVQSSSHTSSGTRTTSVHAPMPLPRRATASGRRPPARVTTASERTHPPTDLMLARARDLLGLSTPSVNAPGAVHRDGVLLLLCALALAMLVVASLALLRLVRLNAQWWEGRTP